MQNRYVGASRWRPVSDPKRSERMDSGCLAQAAIMVPDGDPKEMLVTAIKGFTLTSITPNNVSHFAANRRRTLTSFGPVCAVLA